jgi:hypothetical protein
MCKKQVKKRSKRSLVQVNSKADKIIDFAVRRLRNDTEIEGGSGTHKTNKKIE